MPKVQRKGSGKTKRYPSSPVPAQQHRTIVALLISNASGNRPKGGVNLRILSITARGGDGKGETGVNAPVTKLALSIDRAVARSPGNDDRMKEVQEIRQAWLDQFRSKHVAKPGRHALLLFFLSSRGCLLLVFFFFFFFFLFFFLFFFFFFFFFFLFVFVFLYLCASFLPFVMESLSTLHPNGKPVVELKTSELESVRPGAPNGEVRRGERDRIPVKRISVS
jgi:hypothetical protein